MIAQILTCLGLGWYALMWGFAALGLYVARTRYRPPPVRSPLASLPPSDVPGVTILRPLCGFDCNLYENLEASFLQDYPKFDIIFSVSFEDDAAIPIVHALMDKYPQVSAQLIIGDENVGVNPKINNLIRPYRLATHDILWILDSNVLTSTGTLARSVSLLTAPPSPSSRPIGLVHHLPFAIYPDTNLGSRVEQVFLCTTHAKMYLAINYLAVASCVTGKSCLYRKSDLERAAAKKREGGKGHQLADGEGGLAAFGKYLGEDNMIGEAIWDDLGMRHAMGGDVAGNAVGSMDFTTFFRRRVRWIRVRKYMVIASTLIEPLTECLPCGLLGSLLLLRTLSLPILLTLPLHILLWLLTDLTIYLSLLPASPSPSRSRPASHDGPGLAFLQAWAVRELMAFPIWAFAMMGNTVGWRESGRTYRVRRDGSVGLVREEEGDGWAEGCLRRVRRRMGERKGYVTISPDEEERV